MNFYTSKATLSQYMNNMIKKSLVLFVAVLLFSPSKGQDSNKGNIAFINGIEMFYEIHGTGEPLILLHGFFGSGEWWDFVIDDFSKQYQVIVPDLRGHGRSTNPLEKWTMAQSALDIYALLDHLGIDKINGIGVSTGAKTLLHMATMDPERMKAMVLIGGTMYYPEKFREAIGSGSFTIDKVSDEQWENLRMVHIHGDQQIRKLYRQFNECAEDYEDMAFTSPSLSTIKARTMIIHGDRDWAYPVNIALEMYESIQDSYLWVVPNGGHWPFSIDNTETFIRTTLAFLTKWQEV